MDDFGIRNINNKYTTTSTEIDVAKWLRQVQSKSNSKAVGSLAMMIGMRPIVVMQEEKLFFGALQKLNRGQAIFYAINIWL